MNLQRNQNSHFSNYPVVTMNRSQLDRTHSVKMTFPVAKLVPFEIDEVLPGDTFDITTAAVCRMATPLYPVMGEAFLDYYYFFVPQRLVWEHTAEFYGENKTTFWEQPTEYFIPQVPLNSATSDHFSVADYFGLPPMCDKEVSALPFRAYGLIWNEWFRNENYQEPVLITTGDTEDYMYRDYYNLLPVNRFRDYFSTSLPSPQKGHAITLPFADYANVITVDEVHQDPGPGIKIDGSGEIGLLGRYEPSTSDTNLLQFLDASGEYGDGIVAGTTPSDSVHLMNAVADLRSASAITVNDMRLAFQLQKILERQARSGSRFTEWLQATWGVISPDARLQRPEYLGGNRVQIQVNQVVQTSSSSDSSVLGATGAVSKTVFKNNSFVHSFVEPGYLIGVCCVRYNHTYQSGIERMWSRRRRYDFYDPALAHIGEQAVLKKEIYAYGSVEEGNEVWGYQEAFADYRYKPNRVAGSFRSNIPDGSLDSWVYVDDYQSVPYLDGAWIAEDSAPLRRTLALTGTDQNSDFICDIQIRNISTRVMPVYSIPGLIDHF